MLKRFLIALTFSTALTIAAPQPVQAAPIVGAVAAFASTALGSIVVNTVIGVGLSLIAQALRPKAKAPQQQEQKFGVQPESAGRR